MVSSWANCYDDQWRDMIVPEAFSHPAKFSPGLIRRIFAHGLDKGYWKPGDLIGDPFGGIAGGGINAAYAKLNWIGVELEEKFCRLGDHYECPGMSKAEWVRWYGRFSRGKHLCHTCQNAPPEYKKRWQNSIRKAAQVLRKHRTPPVGMGELRLSGTGADPR